MDKYDDLLQQKLEAIEAGQSLDVALADLPEGARGLGPLVRLAASVRDAPHPVPKQSSLQAQAQLKTAIARDRRSHSSWSRFIQNPWSQVALISGIAGVAMLMFFFVLGMFSLSAWMFGPRGARVATLMDVNGAVQVAPSAGDDWQIIEDGDRVKAGQRIRTGPESEATLVFFDGSRATLGPNADVILQTVDGRWGDLIEVEIDQKAGKTTHSVVPLQGRNSFYQVHTPSGTASVHGTVFSVAVESNGQTRYAVNTGKVQIIDGQEDMFLAAGQATLAQLEGLSMMPAYQFNLTGEVTLIEGDTWVVNEVAFRVTPETIRSGDPDVGSTVFVEGRIMPDGERVADRVEVVETEATVSTFTGILYSMDGPVWMVDGVEIQVDEQTEVDDDLVLGLPVIVTFRVMENRTWLALRIEALEEEDSEPQPDETDEVEPTLETPTPIVDCTGANPHPTGQKLAQRYGVPYEEIMGWFCQRFGFGEIDLAYGLSSSSGMPVTEIFALRRSGLGWGEIKALLKNITLTPTPEITATVTVTATMTLTPTLETPVVTETPLPPEETDCTGANPHPTGQKLAQRYGVSYEEIMGWFCQGFGFGEIDLAYSLSLKSGKPVAEIFAMRRSGLGWGEIKKQLDPKPLKTKKPKKK